MDNIFKGEYTTRDRIRDAEKLFASQEGKRFLKLLEDYCGVFKTTQAVDQDALAYNAGKKDVYIFIRNLITAETIEAIENDRSARKHHKSRTTTATN